MIGIFGGTFDPVHTGHLRTALDVQEALALDELRFVPLGQAVHREQPQTSASRRIAMLQAAIADQPGFVLDTRELQRDTLSYTVDTLESLRAELGMEMPLCLLMGRDAFSAFADWHLPEKILTLAHLVVMDRAGYALPKAGRLHDLMNGHLAASAGDLQTRAAGKILFQPVTRLDISSSDIRKRLAAGKSIRYLVPDAVLDILLSSA